MKIFTVILTGLLFSVSAFGQSVTRPKPAAPIPDAVKKADTTKPVEKPAVKPSDVAPEKSIKPDAEWMREYKQTLSLNKQINKIDSETGVLDLLMLREELSLNLLNKIPKGYEFNQDEKTQEITFIPTKDKSKEKPAEKK